MEQEAEAVILQYVEGVAAGETWNSFRYTVCSPSWAMTDGQVASCAEEQHRVMKKVARVGFFLTSSALLLIFFFYACERICSLLQNGLFFFTN